MRDPGGTTTGNCPACDAPLHGGPSITGVDRWHRTRGTFDVAVCVECGTGATVPPATSAELASFYPRDYAPHVAPTGLVAKISRFVVWYQMRRILARKPLLAIRDSPPGRLLDIGCGRGDLAAAFIARGWRATGVEPSRTACATASERGIDSRMGVIEDVELDDEAYDAAVFQHSLEHSQSVSRALERVAHALRPDGLLAITVPNFGCWQRRRFGSRWFHFDLPRHRVHFSATGLGIALDRAGFQLESLSTSTSTVGLPGSLQYVVAGRCLFPAGLPLRIASGLCILTLPAARVANRLGGGGDQLDVLARRVA